MIQWLKRRLGRGEEPEDPSPPEPSEGETETTVDVYEATIEYRNGDTDTFECHRAETSGNTITFKTTPRPHIPFMSRIVRLGFDERTEHYEVLAREPLVEKVREETYRLTWVTEWKQDRRGLWDESVDEESIQMEQIA